MKRMSPTTPNIHNEYTGEFRKNLFSSNNLLIFIARRAKGE